MDSQEKTFKNPIEEQRKAALEHYEQASRAANHWSSFVESAIKAYSPESCPPPVSGEVVSQLFLYDNISPDFIPIDNLEEAKKYVEANYTEDEGIHPDFHSFPIYKKVGSVDADINGEDICTSIVVSPSPSAPVVAEQVLKKVTGIYERAEISPELLNWDELKKQVISAMQAYAASLHSPADRLEGDAVDCVYEIDFGGNLKCRMKIVGNKINVEAAMNGWGDGISIDEIKITELKTPHHE